MIHWILSIGLAALAFFLTSDALTAGLAVLVGFAVFTLYWLGWVVFVDAEPGGSSWDFF